MDPTVEEPSKGGSYVRNEDGSLTLVQRTQERPMRDKRNPDNPQSEESEAPAPAADAGAGGDAPSQE